MEIFQKLGAEIERSWRDQNYNEERFPALAADALRRADLPSQISAWDVIEWSLQQSELPPQKDPKASFGDPPITLYVGPRFYIDIYFWINGTTEIHQHAFCGAFQVLLGSSLHTWYEFERSESLNAFTELGTMTVKLCELLKLGDVKEILGGRQYIHSLFHLDQPSATIVARTDRSPHHGPQFSYYKPFLALDPFFEHQTTSRQLEIVRALFHAQYADTDRLIAETLASSDFQKSFLILSRVRDYLSGTALDKLFNLGQPAERFNKFLDIVRQRHGSRADALAEIFEFRDRTYAIIRRRGYVTDPEHRYFFALLLNVEGRKRIFELIKARFPDAEPISKILDWTYDLARTRVVGVSATNALGIEDFDDLDLSILEHLLHGRSDEVVRRSLADEYSAERIGAVDIDEKIRKIRKSSTFLPLMTD